jgi:RNA polymerase sigma-70 factor (ECF subfamily)
MEIDLGRIGLLKERVRRSPVVDTIEPSDEDLCRRVAEREDGAFDLLVARYQERAYRIAWSVVRDREEAKDCSQEAFLRVHESAGSFAGQAKFSTWFYRILVNCCLDQTRKRKGWRKLMGWGGKEEERDAINPVERVAAPFTDPTDAMVTESRMSQLWEAVEELSPQQRAAVQLQCREELSTKEIAVVLHLSEATVRVHLHRAYSALRRRVGDSKAGDKG